MKKGGGLDVAVLLYLGVLVGCCYSSVELVLDAFKYAHGFVDVVVSEGIYFLDDLGDHKVQVSVYALWRILFEKCDQFIQYFVVLGSVFCCYVWHIISLVVKGIGFTPCVQFLINFSQYL